ncbi:APC family permease [archaeon]|nr:APC family permease [archaeon]
MVKRGEVKHKSRHAAARKKHGGMMPRSGVLARDERSEIRSAEKVLAKEEKVIERGLNWAFGPQEFHVVTFIASLIILAFLFKSTSIIFYAVISSGVLLFAHFLRQHSHHPHHIVKILGLFFLPLAITIAVFRDFFVWLLLGIYVVSTISTMIIYYHHKKVHTPLKIMWQVTYSRVVAITLALIVACLIPYVILSDSFMSVFELIFAFVFPVSLVLFFASKFFYTYFFDRMHIKSDIMRSLRHSLIYSLIFIVLLMCTYSLFAVSYYNYERESYNDALDFNLVYLSELEKSFDKSPGAVQRMMVGDELMAMIYDLRDDINAEKNLASEPIAFSEIVDDSYFVSIGNDKFNRLPIVLWLYGVSDLKEGVVRIYDNISATLDQNLTFYDGTKTLAEHDAQLKGYVEANFVPLSTTPAVQDIFSVVGDSTTRYSDYEDQGIYYWMSKEAKLDFVYESKSIFGRQMSLVLRHSSVFRELARMFVRSTVFISIEAESPASIERLYAYRELDSSLLSSTIRYELIRQHLLERQGKAQPRIDFTM